MNNASTPIARIMQYIFAISISAIICAYLCLFAINKSRSTNIAIAKTTASSFISSQQHIEQKIKSAIIAVNYYLESIDRKGINYKTQSSINSIARQLGIEKISVYDASGASEEGEIGSSMMNPEFYEIREESNTSNIGKNGTIIGDDFNYKFYSIGDGAKKSAKYKKLIGVGWVKSRQKFLVARLSNKGLTDILKNTTDVGQVAARITIDQKSGESIIDTCEDGDLCKNISAHINDLGKSSEFKSKSILIKESLNFSTISIPLAASIGSCSSYDSDAYIKDSDNSGNLHTKRNCEKDYQHNSYRMNVSFSNSGIQIQVLTIISTFVAIAGLLCNTIYRYGIESEQLQRINEYEQRNSDKISEMCNEKLLEARQYVTKITKEGMRVRSVSRDIQREVVLILEKAFNKVSNIEDEEELEQRRSINFGGVFRSEHIRKRELERA